MGKYEFNAYQAHEAIKRKVEAGINKTLEEIFDVAVELVPVRKAGRRKPKTTSIGYFKAKHVVGGGRKPVTITGSAMYRAYKATGGTASMKEFRQLKIVDRSRTKKSLEEEDFSKKKSASGRHRKYALASERGGTLKDSIEIVYATDENGVITGSVRAGAPYARYVEFPTSRTAAQPFLLPAFKLARNRLKANIKAAKGG